MNLRRIVGPDPWSIKADERQLNNIVTALMDLGSARPMSDCIFICMRVSGVSWSSCKLQGTLPLTQRVGGLKSLEQQATSLTGTV